MFRDLLWKWEKHCTVTTVWHCLKKLGKEKKFLHLRYTLESSLLMVSIQYFHSEIEITYHSVYRFQNLISFGVFGKGAATLEEAWRGDSSVLHVFFLTKKDDILQKLDPLSFAFGLVTHLTHHVLKLTHGLALFERAAIVERRTFGTDAFLFLGKLGIWAATTEKCWAVLRYVIYGDVWLLKGWNKNGNLRLNDSFFNDSQNPKHLPFGAIHLAHHSC